jgi:large subunit ribosomal protein L28
MIQENNNQSKGGKSMAAGRCDVCERKPQYGSNVSHSKRHTNRRFVLNIQHRRLPINGVTRYVNICTRCLRTLNKVPKAR